MFLCLIMGRNNRIQVFFNNGTYLRDWGIEGKGAGESNHPAVIAFDDAENLYVTDSDNQRIQIFSKNGTFITGFGQMGDGPGEFSKPESITIDSDGRVYVVDTTNNNVLLFIPSN